jgi:hypothetical protein
MSNELKVKTVKKGDVLFLLDSKIELIKKLLANDENSEVEFANTGARNLQDWANGRVSARVCDLDTLKELRTYINTL